MYHRGNFIEEHTAIVLGFDSGGGHLVEVCVDVAYKANTLLRALQRPCAGWG